MQAIDTILRETKRLVNTNRLIATAEAEIGYVEKATAQKLDDKKANPGNRNFTKYARDLYPELQAQPWCDIFVDWCFMRTFGVNQAKHALFGYSAYTPTSAALFKKNSALHDTPRVGDVVFFKNSTRICHTGIVIAVDAEAIYTIEGNTAPQEGVVANGGEVCKKKYSKLYKAIAGYGRPLYEEA